VLAFGFDGTKHDLHVDKTANGYDFTLDGVKMVTRDFEEFEINGTHYLNDDVLLA